MDQATSEAIESIQEIAQVVNPKSPGAFLLGIAVIELASEHVMPNQMIEMLEMALKRLVASMDDHVRTAGPSQSEPSVMPAPVPPPKPRFRVHINYFKVTGKWYAEGSYDSEAEYYHELVSEVQHMFREHRRPGLVDGPLEFFAHVIAEREPLAIPFLVRPGISYG